MVDVHIAEEIIIKGLDEKNKAKIAKGLTIENPAYFKVVRLTGNRYSAQANFKYYQKQGDNLIVPRGTRERTLNFLKVVDNELTITENFVEKKLSTKCKLLKPLREYQEKVISQAILKREGVIKMGTGSGKTAVGASLVAKIGLAGTVLVPNTVLLNQFKDEFKAFYGIEVGVIGDGKKEWDKDVVVSTWQSLSADGELLKKLAEKTSVLVIDEIQGIVSDERKNILRSFRPKYLFGLTATPFRSKDDGRTEAIHFLCGPIIAEYNATLMTPSVEVIRTCIGDLIYNGNYHELVDSMVRNNNRNNLIKGLIIGEILLGRKTMILTKRIEHYKLLKEKLWDNDLYIYIDSEDKNRNDTLAKLRSGEKNFSAIFGTISLLSAGTDIPQVETIIFASDIKSSVLTTQMAGRILRLFSGKKEPKIIDLLDNKCEVLRRQFYERKRVYDNNKWIIKGLK